jgi:hypothetical protein
MTVGGINAFSKGKLDLLVNALGKNHTKIFY